MIVSLEAQFEAMEQRTEATLRQIAQSLALGVTLENHRYEPDAGVFQYDLSKYADVISPNEVSMEDISNASKKVWERTTDALKKLQTESIEYARVINLGADRIVERTQMLYGQVQNLKDKPYKTEFTLKSPKKFNRDGTYEPKDVASLVSVSTSAFAFFDKVFVKYIDSVSGILSKLSFDDEFTDEAAMDFSPLAPTSWMAKAEPVEKDDRFRVSAPIFRTPMVQGNKAIYASGPTETKTDELKNWAFLVNTVRDFSFRWYTVPGMKTAPSEALVIQVDPLSNIRQRLGQLQAISKRMQARKGYESKLAQSLRRMQMAGEKVRSKAGTFKVETDEQTEEPKQIKGRPAVSDIIQSVTLMINNVARMVTDYNNAMAGILRLLGSLTYMAELELKAYQPPLRKPTQDEMKGNGNVPPT
jgi:hypothetical protein